LPIASFTTGTLTDSDNDGMEAVNGIFLYTRGCKQKVIKTNFNDQVSTPEPRWKSYFYHLSPFSGEIHA
jgi:hypothetical protein